MNLLRRIRVPFGSLRHPVCGRVLVDTRDCTEFFGIIAAEVHVRGKSPYDILIGLLKQFLNVCGRNFVKRRSGKPVFLVRQYLPVLEGVILQRIDYDIVLVAEDCVAVIEELKDEVVLSLGLSYRKVDDSLNTVLADVQNPSALNVFSQKHRVARRIFGCVHKRLRDMGAPCALGYKVVFLALLTVQSEAEGIDIILVNLPNP